MAETGVRWRSSGQRGADQQSFKNLSSWRVADLGTLCLTLGWPEPTTSALAIKTSGRAQSRRDWVCPFRPLQSSTSVFGSDGRSFEVATLASIERGRQVSEGKSKDRWHRRLKRAYGIPDVVSDDEMVEQGLAGMLAQGLDKTTIPESTRRSLVKVIVKAVIRMASDHQLDDAFLPQEMLPFAVGPTAAPRQEVAYRVLKKGGVGGSGYSSASNEALVAVARSVVETLADHVRQEQQAIESVGS